MLPESSFSTARRSRAAPPSYVENSQKHLQGRPSEITESPARRRRARSSVAPHGSEGSDELNSSLRNPRRSAAADLARSASTEKLSEVPSTSKPAVPSPAQRRPTLQETEAAERQKTARRSLAEAMENHDVHQIRHSLKIAAKSGVSHKEVSAAQRMLDFEVNQNIVREVNEVRAAVDRLTQVVQEVEERASRAEEWTAQKSAASAITGAMPVESWIADIVSRVEEGLWEALQPRVEESIRESISKAKQELLSAPRASSPAESRQSSLNRGSHEGCSARLSPGCSPADSRRSSSLRGSREGAQAFARPPPLADLEVPQASSRPSSSAGSRRPSQRHSHELQLEAKRESQSSVGSVRSASRAEAEQPGKAGVDKTTVDADKPVKKARKPVSETDLEPYFQDSQDDMQRVLKGDSSEFEGDLKDMVDSVPSMILEPQNWGIRVKDVKAFYNYIHEDLQEYVQEQQDLGEDVAENLHVVTPRFIKPWTKAFPSCSLASVINANQLLTKKVNSLQELMTARVFISHCWNEHFGDFINTMNSVLHQDDVVWICAISICQNVDIQGILGDTIEDSPFWRAMPHCRRVAMLIDRKAEPFERAWCALEEYLATYKLRLPFSICMPDNMDEEAWVEVDRKLQDFSIRDCKASEESDKQKIMGIIADKADIIDRVVRDESQKACFAARVMKVAVSGTTSELVPLAMNALAQVSDSAGRSILHICAQWGRVEQLQGLVDNDLKLNSRCSVGKAPLHYAAESGHAATAQLLLSCNAEVNARDQLRWTPLSVAASKGQVRVAQALVNAGADIDAEDSEGHTPLLNTAVLPTTVGAQDGADVDIAQLLLAMRANIHAKDHHGHSVLTLAAQAGKHDITRLFIHSGANLDERDVDGCTPLMFAAGIGHLEVTRALLQGKADPLLEDAMGCNALAFAEDAQHKEIVHLLERSVAIANLRARLSRQSLSES